MQKVDKIYECYSNCYCKGLTIPPQLIERRLPKFLIKKSPDGTKALRHIKVKMVFSQPSFHVISIDVASYSFIQHFQHYKPNTHESKWLFYKSKNFMEFFSQFF